MVVATVATLFGPMPKSYAQSDVDRKSERAAPTLLSYQGVLADMQGLPVPDGSYLVTMRIYDTSEGGQPLWEESLRVETFDGFFDAYLGLNSRIDLPFDREYWLAAKMQGEAEMTPRTRLVAAPYAIRAVSAGEAEGLRPGAYGAVRSINGTEGDLTIVGGEGISVRRRGDTIVISGNVKQDDPVVAGEPVNLVPRAAAEDKMSVYETKGHTGILKLRMGGADLGTYPPKAGSFQDLGSIFITNPHVTTESVVHVSVVDKRDDIEANEPSPINAIFMADVRNRGAGMYEVRIGMVPTVSCDWDFQKKDEIYLGYTISNPTD